MNSKRQTIWLVSMLSLMVVLSAYYLFTEDVNELDFTAVSSGTTEMVLNTNDLNSAQLASSGAAGSESVDGAEAAPVSGTISEAEANVLKQVEGQSKAVVGTDYFLQLQMQRHESIQKQMEELIGITGDPSQTAEAAETAIAKIRQIEEMEMKIDALETALRQDYNEAAVIQEADKWKVVVQAPQLERSEVLSIMDQMMTELAIGPEQVAGVTPNP